jgi:hypothetical protein
LTFEVVGESEAIATVSAGASVKVRTLFRKLNGRGRWQKRKGVGTVRLPNGNIRRAELHWYEARGIGRRDLKIKNYLDQP